MGYLKGNKRYAKTRVVDMVAEAEVPDGSSATAETKTATANGNGVELGDVGTLRLKLNVTAASGTTPTLDIKVQTSADNGVTDAWRDLAVSASFGQKTGVAAEQKCFVGCDRWVRVVKTIGGTTPSFTYTIFGEAV